MYNQIINNHNLYKVYDHIMLINNIYLYKYIYNTLIIYLYIIM